MAADWSMASLAGLMSSPDPLNESILTPPSRRVTRSQAPQRLFSLGPSPKKQTFELDVGNDLAPQKILVTVEAEDANASRTSRRLFGTPTPKRSVRRSKPSAGTTTTTVPLRGLTDDEAHATSDAPTSRRRGRPPKPRLSGTPTTTRRKRPPTPAPKIASKTGGPRASLEHVAASDIGAEDELATPRAKSRPGRTPKRKATSPAKDDGAPASQPRKRGRPRKDAATASEDLVPLSEQESNADGGVEDNASVAPSDDNFSATRGEPLEEPHNSEAYNMEDDIWLATLSDQPSPVGRRSHRRDDEMLRALEPEQTQAPSDAPPSEMDFSQHDAYSYDGGRDPHSEAESLASDGLDLQDREDTVVAEEFTMISIGSLPSMQPNSSMMAPEHQDIGDATSLIINRTLEALRQSYNRPVEGIPEPQPSSADADDEPRENADVQPDEEPAQQELQPQSQPQSPQAFARSPRRPKAQPLSRQLALKSLHQGDSIDSPHRLAVPETTEAHETSIYDDSFSEIPEEVLIAATPRRLRVPEAEAGEQDAYMDIQPSVERPSTVNHSNPQSESNRLLTPEETPSPLQSDNKDDPKQTVPTEPALDQVTDVRSSPPISSDSPQQHHNVSVMRHSRTNSTETPAEQRSSFSSPAVAAHNAQAPNLAPPEVQPRPTLSPIVRAGRALQLVTSDPPSPPARDSVLGSPFRRSVTKSSQSPVAQSRPPTQVDAPAEQPEKSWLAPLNQLKNLVVQGAQAFSPRNFSTAGMEDPFAPNPSESSRPGSVRISIFNLGSKSRAGGQGVGVDESGSVVGLARATSPEVNDSDAMSWEAEGSPSRAGGQERSPSASSSLDLEDDEVAEDDDDDIWAIEAQRAAPASTENASSRREESFIPPRRSKLPSPWRKNSKRLMYSDELHQLAMENSRSNEVDEFSMISQGLREEQRNPRNPAPPTKVDLSAFFSSPAALPEIPAPGFGLFKALDARRTEKPLDRPSALQGFQAASATQTARNNLATEQPEEPQPRAQKSPRSVPQKELHIEDRPRRPDLFSPVRQPAGRAAPAAQVSPSSSPENAMYGHVPQKMNFTPLRRSKNDLFEPTAAAAPGNSLFGDSRVSNFSNPAPPPEDEQGQPSSASPELDFMRPQARPRPDRAMSPTKSCMRSPLKPKTPGRVVEFTSSTLSPLAQAQVRAERRASASPEKEAAPSPPRGGPAVAGDDKENQHDEESAEEEAEQQQQQQPAGSRGAPEAFSFSASPSASNPEARRPTTTSRRNKSGGTGTAAAARAPLSKTEWSRDHWLRLDELLQARRHLGALHFQLQHPPAASAAARARQRAATARRLLGKRVTAQGESVALEQWHLDVVAAFAAEVGTNGANGSGWDETALAKRLFALLVGEQRRRDGKVPLRRDHRPVDV
ncbi:hypothetical protein B0T24DRAFT_706337 [Lasiosphaeria ovina]|uniref:Uncharacterized protein n=1 Tax=Lasiosphaeria ovina TaxID=92902 RepID=A0AAE0K7M8_9PEZI|nr:hypothetical protein B0T24DRAFT_706337 [Lasiosphaeria ovina]